MNILVIPGCDDTNRGDQALIWESVRIAKDAGLNGNFYMISTEECSLQSQNEGIFSTPYILPHPSVHFKRMSDNRKYTTKLKLLWGIRAICDLCVAVPLTQNCFRKIFKHFLPKDKKRTLNLYEDIDVAIVKGGGFLHANSGLAEIYKIYFFLYHIILALSMNIPVLVMPNSYGPFESRIARRLIRKTLSKCDIVTSRESISHDILLNECNVESKVTMDLGAYLQKAEKFNPYKYLESKNIKFILNKNVVITVRPYRFPSHSNPQLLYEKYIMSIVELIEWLNDNGYQVVLAEHVYSHNYHESDMKAIEDIQTKLDKNNNIEYKIISDHSLDCRQMKSIYSCFDYMVGTRFHSVIFALFSNVPSIAITYGGNKGIGIMKDLDIDDYSIGIDVISGEFLINTFKAMIQNRDEYLKKINKNNEIIITQEKSFVNLIEESLRKRNYGKSFINC